MKFIEKIFLAIAFMAIFNCASYSYASYLAEKEKKNIPSTPVTKKITSRSVVLSKKRSLDEIEKEVLPIASPSPKRRLRPRQVVRKNEKSTDSPDSGSNQDASSPSDNYSDELHSKDKNQNIDTMTEAELEDFFIKQNVKMHSLCQKADNLLTITLTELDNLLVATNKALASKVQLLQTMQKYFLTELKKVNPELEKKSRQ